MELWTQRHERETLEAYVRAHNVGIICIAFYDFSISISLVKLLRCRIHAVCCDADDADTRHANFGVDSDAV